MSSKNNPENRGQSAAVKKVGGKIVKPVKYVGKHHQHGNYIAAMYETGEMVMNPVTKKPTPYAHV